MQSNSTVNVDGFHPMRGHMVDGQQVEFPDGQVHRVKACMIGWVLVSQSGEHMTIPTNDCTVFTTQVVSLAQDVRNGKVGASASS